MRSRCHSRHPCHQYCRELFLVFVAANAGTPFGDCARIGYIATETVPVETLADLIAQRFPGGAPRFALKIDTQGFEDDVLDGLGGQIEHCTAILLEMPLAPLYGEAPDLPTLFTRLTKYNFCCVGLLPGHKNTRTGDAIEVDGLFVREVSDKPAAFPLFTSIPPCLSGEALAQQREVIASWRAAGFELISVNGPSEISQLKLLGLDIEVEPALVRRVGLSWQTS
jgi:hypothetical protein